MIQDIVEELICLHFETIVVEHICKRNDAIIPIWSTFIQLAIFGISAKPDTLINDRIEVIDISS